jgi:hypothetical protein
MNIPALHVRGRPHDEPAQLTLRRNPQTQARVCSEIRRPLQKGPGTVALSLDLYGAALTAPQYRKSILRIKIRPKENSRQLFLIS